MKAMRIEGGVRLEGRLRMTGAKNAALPMMTAALLTAESVRLRGFPDVADVRSMAKLLALFGVASRDEGPDLVLTAGDLPGEPLAPYELVRTMRASVLVLGPLLVRHGRAIVSLPGGCAIGARPIDQHLKGLEALGARIRVEGGYVHAECDGLRGARITFDIPTVTGTENLMLAAAMADGESVLDNVAREPEIGALADLLRSMGAHIEGDGTTTIHIAGRSRLGAGDATVIPDRIQTGTYLCAVAATRGEVELTGARPEHIDIVLDRLARAGAKVEAVGDCISLWTPERLKPVDIETAPFPGFPTDLQAQWLALMATVDGTAMITETIFENRFMHVPELQRMGADIRVHGHTATVFGGLPLTGAPVMATDLRASAGLVIAGLASRGTTEVLRIYHLERGYENLAGGLAALGARVEIFERDATVPHADLAAAEGASA